MGIANKCLISTNLNCRLVVSKLMIALRNGLKPNLAVQYLLRTQKEYLPNFTPNAISRDFVSIAFNLNKNKKTYQNL